MTSQINSRPPPPPAQTLFLQKLLTRSPWKMDTLNARAEKLGAERDREGAWISCGDNVDTSMVLRPTLQKEKWREFGKSQVVPYKESKRSSRVDSEAHLAQVHMDAMG